MTEPVSHYEFKKKVDRAAKLIAVSDGIYHFLGGEVKTLFSKDKGFRDLVREKLPPSEDEREPELIRAKDYLLAHRDNFQLLVEGLKEDRDLEVITPKKEDSPILTHSKKIFSSIVARQEYTDEANRILEDLIERGSDQKFKDPQQKVFKREQVKNLIRDSMDRDYVKNASIRYLSNNFPKPHSAGKILKTMQESISFTVDKDSMRQLRESHFSLVGKKLPAKDKKARKARR